MSQHSLSIANAVGATVRAAINSALQALATKHSGASAPSTTYANMWWADTTNGLLKRRNNADSAWIPVISLSNDLYITKSAAYTVVPGDCGKTIDGDATSAAFTVTLPAAATAGEGFKVTIRKSDSGSNAVTVDGDGSETIDGATTRDLTAQYEGITLVSTGADWVIESEAGVSSSSGSGLTWMGEQVTTSGSAWNFTSIPAGVSELHLRIRGFSLSGADDALVQLGDAGGLETSGYTTAGVLSAAQVTSATGFLMNMASGVDPTGYMVLHHEGSNVWSAYHAAASAGGGLAGGGIKTLSAELDRLTLTRTGSNTGDGGSINLGYR